MEKTVLIITAMDGAENLARAISREADAVVEIAHSRRAALARLRRGPVTAVLLDASLSVAEITTSEMVWQNADGALPLELNLSTLSVSGTVRVLRSLLEGRQQAANLGRQQAATVMAQEVDATLTGLLLESELLLRDKALAPTSLVKVRAVKDLADALRVKLRSHSREYAPHMSSVSGRSV